MSESLLSFFHESDLDTSGGEEWDDRFLALTNNEHVVDSGSEVVVVGVLNVSNIEGSGMSLDVLQNAHSANIVTTSGKNGGTILKLDESIDFSSLEVKLKL